MMGLQLLGAASTSQVGSTYCMPMHRFAACRHSNLGPSVPRHVDAPSLFWGHRLQSRSLLQGVQPGTLELQRTRKCVAKRVQASFFGVGAPEALLVGVVALVVFGPKGLAQAVKSLGATLKTFSPTIREIASISNQLSSNLQEQIGLDEIRSDLRQSLTPMEQPSSSRRVQDTAGASSSLENPKQEEQPSSSAADTSSLTGEDLEAKIAESKRLAWGGASPEDAPQDSSSNRPSAAVKDSTPSAAVKDSTPSAAVNNSTQAAAQLSIEELEAELKRRREGATKSS